MQHALREVATTDVSRLHELLSVPEVYEYLSDGAPLPVDIVEDLVSAAVDGQPPFGLWLLMGPENDVSGCVRLSEVADGAASAEITFVLHPAAWGRVLATAMSRSVMARAFEVPSCESILAGADVPNIRSFEVMKRLGMRFLRNVDYPAGPGMEYVLTRADFASSPSGPSVPFV